MAIVDTHTWGSIAAIWGLVNSQSPHSGIKGSVMSKWLEIGMCVVLNVVLIFVIFDDSIINISGSSFGLLTAFSALAAVDLWFIYMTRRPKTGDNSATPQEPSGDQRPPESFVE